MKKNCIKCKKKGQSLSMMMRGLLTCLSLFLLSIAAWGQSRTVTGTVVSEEDNESIPGATVLIKGTSNGTITDIEGNFRLEVPSEANALTISFVGYKSVEVSLLNTTTVNVSLPLDVTSLDEVVVIGYGSQKKKLLTGATVNVTGEKLQGLSNTNALQSLQGQTAGVNITSVSGQPGAGFKVNIRGVGTIGTSDPLYIVDGLQVSDISYLNNGDIESIDILKDAAAAAIYGSRAANGVVLVTTKKGKVGKAQLSFDAYYGVQTVANKYEMLNAQEYATIMNEQAINSGQNLVYTNEEIAALGKGTDWIDQMLTDNAVNQNYALGLQGGSENSIYSTAMSYTQQEGVVGGKSYSNYERYVFRVNSEHKLYNDMVTIGENLTYTYVNSRGIADEGQYYNSLRSAFNTNPLIPMYDENGDFYNNSEGAFIDLGGQANPYANMVYNSQSENSNQKLVGNVYMSIEPIEGLTFRSQLGVLSTTDQGRSYVPVYRLSLYSYNDTSTVTQNSSKDFSWNWENTIGYKKTIGDHSAQFLIGTTAQKWSGSNMNAKNANLTFNSFKYAYLGNTTYSNGPRMVVGGSGYERSLQSYFGRVLYNYQEKYMFTASLRADGSSIFAKGNRWGVFPAVSAGWVLTNESFLSGILTPVNFFKLRASWGQNGNNFIAPFQYLSTVSLTNGNYIFGNSEGNNTPGAYPDRLSNPDVKWETSEQLDIGFDAEFMNSRLYANFDWYRKVTKDWLIDAPVLATAGAEPPFINGGSVVNQGIEVVLGWRETKGDFTYNFSGNIAMNDNKVQSIPTPDGTVHGDINQLWDNAPEFYRAQDGYPIGYFWGYKTLGVFQNEAQIREYANSEGELIQPSARPGDLIFQDTNGDGAITGDDKTNIGNPNPDLVYGFNFTCSYKRFDLTINANGVAGNKLVQSYRNQSDQNANYGKEILGRWHGEGTSNKLPRVTQDSKNYSTFSDIYIKNGDFLRINNITLGYDFGKLIKADFISQLRFYVTAQNLFTFTKYSGMDPEVGFGQDYSRGVDLGYYPRPRVLMAGVNVKF